MLGTRLRIFTPFLVLASLLMTSEAIAQSQCPVLVANHAGAARICTGILETIRTKRMISPTGESVMVTMSAGGTPSPAREQRLKLQRNPPKTGGLSLLLRE